MKQRDHTVPQMYLRRFAIQRKKGFFTHAARVESLDTPWETNVANVAAPSGYYTFRSTDGEDRRELESFFERIESLATPVLRKILDDPHYALPAEWPLDTDHRLRMAWFIAAQIVRTTRQRRRIEVAGSPSLDLPGTLSQSDLATEHARYIVQAIGAIAYVLNSRPWALAHSSACLIASDCPVVLMGHHDDEDQLLAVTIADIVFPLDPHRLIFMPSPFDVEEDHSKSIDHRIKLDGIGTAFTQAVYDSALEYVFMHPDHVPGPWLQKQGRLPTPGEEPRGHGWVIEYGVLPSNLTILKRWATEHPPTRVDPQP